MTMTRHPVQLVALRQRRCGLRFGVAPCTATGVPLCYQTWGSCGDRDNINQDGSITWIFCRPGENPGPLYLRDGEHIRTNAIPLLESVSAASAELNIAAQRTGVSPLGVGASASVVLRNDLWDDPVGDFYRDSRATKTRGTYWGQWRARNAFATGMMMMIYDGFAGQALEDMQRRDYMVEGMPQFDGGRITFALSDPLRLAEARSAKFPPETPMTLLQEISPDSVDVLVDAVVTDLSMDLGNTGDRRYMRIGSEVLEYTGWTAEGAAWRLSGVSRGTWGSVRAEHAADEACQRAGAYERLQRWRIAADLIDNHTTIPAGYRDPDAWEAEGWSRMITQKSTRLIPSPQGVDVLLGTLCQQGGFSIWWDERARKIPLLANRPPDGTPRRVDEASGMVAGTVSVSDEPELQISRVVVYYAPRNPFDLGQPQNYRRAVLDIDGYVESEAALNAVSTLTIFADWISATTDALRLAARTILRYRLITQYLFASLDGKDRDVAVGHVLDVTTSVIETTEGDPVEARWQVIRAEEVVSGHLLALKLQSYQYIGRFGVIMPADAPDYADATEPERAAGCWLADATTGRMPAGDEPYLLQ